MIESEDSWENIPRYVDEIVALLSGSFCLDMQTNIQLISQVTTVHFESKVPLV